MQPLIVPPALKALQAVYLPSVQPLADLSSAHRDGALYRILEAIAEAYQRPNPGPSATETREPTTKGGPPVSSQAGPIPSPASAGEPWSIPTENPLPITSEIPLPPIVTGINQPATIISPPRVFISYRYDSSEHTAKVVELAQRLRQERNIDARIDQFDPYPKATWPEWMLTEIEEAQFSLLVCTALYAERYRGRAAGGSWPGVTWEGCIITATVIFGYGIENSRFIPVIFSPDDESHIPMVVRGRNRYLLPDQFANLCRHIKEERLVVPYPLSP
jgi:hypothetical protein